MMRKAVIVVLLRLALATAVSAQINNSAPEYGTLTDVRNYHRVYVYSEDLDSRNLILQELRKDQQIEVVGKLEDAEFFIFYGRSFRDNGYTSFGGIFGSVLGTVTTKNTEETAQYYVLMRGDKLENGSYRPRILWGKQNLRVNRGNALVKTKLPQ
jgi:hypothetical protein